MEDISSHLTRLEGKMDDLSKIVLHLQNTIILMLAGGSLTGAVLLSIIGRIIGL